MKKLLPVLLAIWPYMIVVPSFFVDEGMSNAVADLYLPITAVVPALTLKSAIINLIMHFIVVLDVISAINIYRKVRKQKGECQNES